MTDPQIPGPEAGDNPDDKCPSFSPSAKESASKRRERTVACGGDTLTPGDKIPSQTLASASHARAVTADVTEKPEGGSEWPAERPAWWPEGSVYAVGLFRRMGIPFSQVAGEQRNKRSERHADQSSGFVLSVVRRDRRPVTSPVTPSQASPVVAFVTPVVTAGSICPTCQRRVPARLSAAERQKAYRERQREQGKPVVP